MRAPQNPQCGKFRLPRPRGAVAWFWCGYAAALTAAIVYVVHYLMNK